MEKREELTRFPPIWKPQEKGEELVGEIVSKREDEKFGFSLVMKDKDGEEVSTPSHKNLSGTLKGNFESGKLKVGDKIAITYLGMRQAKKAKGGMTDPFNDYKVERVA